MLERCGLLKAAAPPASEDFAQYVNPAIGTGGHGHTYPGATVPFGAVQLSPDTYNDGWDWCSGYHYSDSSIMGFSHTHLSGTGVGDMLDVLVMPRLGEVKLEPGSREHPEEGYRSRFSHEDEIAQPGYYSVLLKDAGIRAELTASERVGLHRYTFAKGGPAHLIVDLKHAFGNDAKINWAELRVIGKGSIAGGRSVAGWANGRQIYFVLHVSKALSKVELYSDSQKLPADTKEVKGTSLKCVLHFDAADGEAVHVKTGLSAVNIAGAQRNLEAEMPGWNFDEVQRAARARWNEELSRVQVETLDETQRTIFYTALYHTMIAPTLFDDVDGRYRGMDGKVHQLPEGRHNYSTFSLWDTYRATHPLYTLILPERVPDFVNCLMRMGEESPAGVPVWPLQGEETGCMTGYHSAAVVAEAAAKGFQGIDFTRAYGPFRKRAMEDDYRGLADYRKYGYLPSDRQPESVSTTIGYAYDDWAVAQIAQAAGAEDDHRVLLRRARNYRNLFDKNTKFMRPKLANGDWAEPFDPKHLKITTQKWGDFTEANSWQETFGNQHDVDAYMELFGGRDAFVKKLDALFNQSSDLPNDMPPDVAGLVGMYAHGNEPGHHVAYLYAYAGVPYKTQARVRSLLETMYRNEPDGMAGNEDCGQMSAWYVISALGFYPVDPVSGNYVLGTPLFDKVTVSTGDGRKLVIQAERSAPSDRYIDSVKLNGKVHEKVWFRHADVARGGTITFTLRGDANTKWGADQECAPPPLPQA